MTFRDCTFVDADLSLASLRQATFVDCDLSGVDLGETVFSRLICAGRRLGTGSETGSIGRDHCFAKSGAGIAGEIGVLVVE